MSVEVLFDGFWLTEAPRFDAQGTLHFSDVMGHKFGRYTAADGVQLTNPAIKYVGGCVMNHDGRVICSTFDGLVSMDTQSGATTTIPTTIDGAHIGALNDLEADADGNIYGGTIDLAAFENGTPPATGSFVRIDTAGSVTRFGPVTTPNGIAFAQDRQSLLFSESGEGIFRYDITSDGKLESRRLFAALDDSDGIALDANGGLWVARYMCNELVYYRKDGTREKVVNMPFNAVTSVAFGGEDLRELYVTGGDLQKEGTGGVARITCDVPGLPVHVARLN